MKRSSVLIIVCSLICQIQVACSQNNFPENEQMTYEVINSTISVPWGIAFLPTGEMLVTDRKGQLYKLTGNVLIEITGVPKVVAEGQGGFLDIAVHPAYTSNKWIYFSYSKGGRKNNFGQALATTAIFRAQLSDKELVKIEEIFVAEPWSTTRHHYGSRIIFDQEGLLYFSVGDRGNRDGNPQSLRNHCGKIHRIKDDGSIPADNPFAQSPVAMPSIYSYGHRNPQGLILNPYTGAIWEHEHGPRGGDELNQIEAGKNFGWPVISYGINYNGTRFTDLTKKEGMEQPLLYWVPSIAPSGMDFVSSSVYGSDWEGNLLIGSLSFQYLNRCIMEDQKVIRQEKVLNGVGRVRSIKQGPDGYIYLGVEGKGILKLIRKN